MDGERFDRFYLQKVALGEGCGCAEQVIRMRDIDEALAGQAGSAVPRSTAIGSMAKLFRRIALAWRPIDPAR